MARAEAQLGACHSLLIPSSGELQAGGALGRWRPGNRCEGKENPANRSGLSQVQAVRFLWFENTSTSHSETTEVAEAFQSLSSKSFGGLSCWNLNPLSPHIQTRPSAGRHRQQRHLTRFFTKLSPGSSHVFWDPSCISS